MASANFFVPLNRVKLRGNRGLDFVNNKEILPSWIQNVISEYRYSNLDKIEKPQKFYFKYTLFDTKKTIERQITIVPYVVHYKPSKRDNDYYYLMLKVNVDKLFSQIDCYTSIEERFCTIDDIIYLKKLFFEDQLYYPRYDSTVTVQKWINNLINKLEKRPSDKQIRRREYTSLVNLYAVRIKEPFGGYCEFSIAEEFNKAYYGNELFTVENTLGNNGRLYLKQAYGLLLADDNYRRVQDKELDSVLCDNFSNNICEEFYAVRSSMLWVHTHNPFDNNEISQKALNFHDNLYEMCEVMSARQKLNKMSKLFTISSANEIKKQLASLSAYMESNTFNLLEMDKKLEYLFKAMGLNDEFNSVKEIGGLAAEGANIELTHHQNFMITVLTFCSVLIGLMTIFPFSTNNNCNMLNMILNKSGCNEVSINFSLVIVFLLLLVVILLVLICINSFKIRRDLKNALKVMEDMQ